ncbi:unnamed protein product [Rotaria sp. Silwood2]|nr:unnamed protein product [Rotaria sp. Silwood2]
MYLNEATLLNNIRRRYKKDLIYTYVANILIAINPYKQLSNLYSIDAIKRYNGKSLGIMPPHVYAIGDKAYRDMRRVKQSQSIIISGESGAGKTESAKYVLRYLTESYGTYVANILIAINPYKQLSNLYSIDAIKRYNGKSLGVMPPHVYAIGDKAYRDMRRIKQSQSIIISGESGAGKTESAKYVLRYLTESYGVHNGQIEDRTNESNPLLEAFGNAKKLQYLFSSIRVVGGYISHYLLEKSRVCVQSKDERNYHVFYQLCAGASESTRRELRLSSPDNFHVFAFVNKSIPFSSSTSYIGILDIAGFEYFPINSFEQFCTNYCNEKLQQFFNERIIKEEQSLYEKEGLGLKKISYIDNQDCIGKTESAKYVLRYLTESYGVHNGQIEDRINESNPLLEAFGNAKTTRNNNSSRFGKFIEVHFNDKHRVVGGYISHYLLEKSRVCVQSKDERNYHVFYQLCAGASESTRRELRLSSPDNFHFISKGPLHDPQLDDLNNFNECNQSMDQMGLTTQDKLNIYSTVAAVLHVGNIDFEDNPESTKGGCKITSTTEKSLSITAEMLGLDQHDLRNALITRVLMTKTASRSKETVISVPLKVHEAQNARDALAKAIYIRLFDQIVAFVNKSIPFSSSTSYIGILDIAGFEYFPINSFEQFCTNYCNEKLQQFFNERILKEEQLLYEKEGLGLKKISYIDNQDCIDLVEAKTTGCFDLLDEESKLPTPRPEHFTNEVYNRNKGHPRLNFPRKSKLRTSRGIRDDEGFLVQHFAGSVVYSTAQFIEKNNDALHVSLLSLAQESRNSFIKSLFSNVSEHEKSVGKLNFISVGSKFRSQLSDLLNKLRRTDISFIRCIKPNLQMVPNLFEGGHILSQLQCSGMVSVLDLMQQGFPSRTQFSELYRMYKSYLPKELARLDPRLFCKALFKALNLRDTDFKFGLTKNLAVLISKVKKWILWTRWKKAQWCVLSVIKLKNKILYRRQCLVDIQRHIRMHLVYKRYAPQIQGLVKVKALYEQVSSMEKIVRQMKLNKEQVYKSVQQLRQRIDQLVNEITNRSVNSTYIDNAYNELVSLIDREFRRLKQVLAQQEMELEHEKTKKIVEKKRLEQEQEEFRQRSAMAQHQREQAQLKGKLTANETKHRKKRQVKETDEEDRFAEMNERERRDYDLARRLALETGDEADLSELQQPYRRLINPKYNFNRYTYAELRDSINTSCDWELLQACREELRQRVKLFYAWK